jgi:transcriptional regulator with XRE-family HTH domain
MTENQAISLRTKMLGALVREARLEAGKSIRESAELLGISPSTFSSYEHGRKGISLPELEVLCYFFETTLAQFLRSRTQSATPKPQIIVEREITLRQRLIGARIRKHRQAEEISIKALAERIDFPASRISAYERGKRSIPLPELEVLAGALGRRVEDYIELDGPIGNWLRERRAKDAFAELPLDLQEFVTDPANLTYVRLAHDLRQLPAEELRSVKRSFDEIIP